MKRRSTRLESWRWAALVLPLAIACNDETTQPVRTIALTQELRFVPSGFRGEFSATAALRVNWSFRIDRVPEGDDPRRPVYKQRIDAQELFVIGWDGRANTTVADFAPGDSCIATISYAQLPPEDAERARVGFRL